ncbi:MAG TPA: hypothetical protein VF844_11880, partial [Ktedonobacteraceae bacterium]
MQFDPGNSLPPPVRPRPVRARLVGMSNGKIDTPVQQNREAEYDSGGDVAMQPTHALKTEASANKRTFPVTRSNGVNGKERTHPLDDDISNQSTVHLMQLSGMMRAVRIPQQGVPENSQSVSNEVNLDDEEGYWPQGIQQTGALPVVNLYGSEPFGRTLPRTPAVAPEVTKKQPAWKVLLNTPAAKVTIGLLIGIGLLLLVARFVDLPVTIAILRLHLA